jgi:predicted RNA-binding Zn ribbon-like protein
MNFLVDNWLGLVGFLSAPIMWFLGGKQAKAQELKKGEVEIDSAEIDYAVKVRELYESLLQQANSDKEALKSDKDAIIAEFKEEKEYFRTQVDELRKQAGDMQIQFNAMQLAYAKEVEQSQNWEKLHTELLEKYNTLKDLYDKLKEDFDKHKKLKS